MKTKSLKTKSVKKIAAEKAVEAAFTYLINIVAIMVVATFGS